MDKQDIFQGIMIALLILGSYFGTLHGLSKRAAVKQALYMAAVILLIVYILLAATLFYASSIVGTELVLFVVLLMIALLTLCGTVVYMVEHFGDMNHGILAVFVVYLIVVAYVTVFSRDTTGDHTTSLLRMDMLQTALRTHSLKPIKHILQNVALFVPLGFLLPYIDRENLDNFTCPFLFSLALTVLIESTQLMLNLGQADLTDIAANVLGGILGYLLYRLLCRLGFSVEENDVYR